MTLRGEDHPNTKLSEDEVRQIRYLYEKRGLVQREIAERFGVSRETVAKIVQRKNWRHVL